MSRGENYVFTHASNSDNLTSAPIAEGWTSERPYVEKMKMSYLDHDR